MKKIMIFIYCICLFLMVGCEKLKETVSRNDTKLKVNPAFVALADGDSKLIFLDKKMNIVKEIENKNKFQSFSIEGNRVYAIDDGTYMGTKPSMLIINLSSGHVEKKLKLPHVPSSYAVLKQKVYMASSEIFREGMPFFVVNVSSGKVEKLTFTSGMVSTIKHYKNEIFITINSGGKSSEHSNVYRIQINDASLSFHPVIKDNIELPPSDFVIEDNKMYCVFTGFSYGPRPEWVKNPERYTNKLMVVDLNNGQIISEKKLSKPFPQKIINIGNKLYLTFRTLTGLKERIFYFVFQNNFLTNTTSDGNPFFTIAGRSVSRYT